MLVKNSLVHIAVEVLEGILEDAGKAYPDLSFCKDLQRLRTQSETRGQGFISLDLPSLDKLLLAGLETGALHLEGPLSKPLKSAKVPRFLSGLWLRVFDDFGILREDADVDAIAFLRQIFCFGKRLVSKCHDSIIKEAINGFFDVDKALRPVELWWLDDEGVLDHSDLHFADHCSQYFGESLADYSPSLAPDITRLQSVCDILSSAIGYYDPYSFTGEGHSSVSAERTGVRSLRHGPGAVSDLRGGSDKYQFPSWPDRLQRVFPFDAFGHYGFDVSLMEHMDDISPSKIIDVPKTMDKPRLIASEPTCNQWCQQITRSFLDERFGKTIIGAFVDLHDQQKSADLVQCGSREGHLATVDLSEASDRLSAWTVVRAFRRNRTVLDALRAHRTMYTYHPKYHPDAHLINKFATQGTAVTFPVQSFVFLACALTACTSGVPTVNKFRKLIGKIRVFGDDIILPRQGYVRLVELLTYLGLKVNDKKSFYRGDFLESCGYDGYRGYDVTPVKPKLLTTSSPESVQSILDTCNNLFKKGYWLASERLRMLQIPRLKQRIVAIDSGSQGLCSFTGENHRHLPWRWNDKLHQLEVLVHRVYSICKKRPIGADSAFFQYIAERPTMDLSWSSGIVAKSVTKQKLCWVPA